MGRRKRVKITAAEERKIWKEWEEQDRLLKAEQAQQAAQRRYDSPLWLFLEAWELVKASCRWFYGHTEMFFYVMTLPPYHVESYRLPRGMHRTADECLETLVDQMEDLHEAALYESELNSIDTSGMSSNDRRILDMLSQAEANGKIEVTIGKRF